MLKNYNEKWIYRFFVVYLQSNKKNKDIMTIEQLRPQDKDGVIGQIISICNQVNYLKLEVIPFINNMEAWEAKEYRNLYHSYKGELTNLAEFMIADLNFWNKRLGEYHTSTAVFLQATAYQFN